MFALRRFIVSLILLFERFLLFGFGAVVTFLIIVWWKGHLDIPYLYEKKIGVPEGIRTPDPRFRKPVLYPAELPRLNLPLRCASLAQVLAGLKGFTVY